MWDDFSRPLAPTHRCAGHANGEQLRDWVPSTDEPCPIRGWFTSLSQVPGPRSWGAGLVLPKPSLQETLEWLRCEVCPVLDQRCIDNVDYEA